MDVLSCLKKYGQRLDSEIATLPADAQPRALSEAFPRIANRLAWLWPDGASFTNYLSDLLVDRRGGRKGFPIEVLVCTTSIVDAGPQHPIAPFANSTVLSSSVRDY